MSSKAKKNKSVEEMTDEEFERLLDEDAGERAEEAVMTRDPRFTETHYGPTPSGGAYSVAYYYDEEGMPCRRETATSVNIIEYSEEGYRINETYALLR